MTRMRAMTPRPSACICSLTTTMATKGSLMLLPFITLFFHHSTNVLFQKTSLEYTNSVWKCYKTPENKRHFPVSPPLARLQAGPSAQEDNDMLTGDANLTYLKTNPQLTKELVQLAASTAKQPSYTSIAKRESGGFFDRHGRHSFPNAQIQGTRHATQYPR